MRYLVGTTSVHTTAAICDYLDQRATADDAVTVVAVAPPDGATTRRDAREALNVAPVRLATVGNVETEFRADDREPATVLLEAATSVAADEVLITPRDGTPDAASGSGIGSTARALLEETEIPVVVVPAPEL